MSTFPLIFIGFALCAVTLLAVVGSQPRAIQVVAALTMVVGGLWLLSAKAVGENSLLELGIHGVGFYCLGRGLAGFGLLGNRT